MENIHGEKVCSNSVLSFLAKLQARNLFWSVHDFEKETHIEDKPGTDCDGDNFPIDDNFPIFSLHLAYPLVN